VAHAETEIAASEREVWSVLADINAWATRNPAIRAADLTDDLEVGCSFRYATTFGALRCRLRQVDAPRTLAWSGRLLTLIERQAWSIEPTEPGCHVDGDASLSGIGSRLFRARLASRLQADLGAMVQLLRLEAETRRAESIEHAAIEDRGRE
jgi:hypothetical protein